MENKHLGSTFSLEEEHEKLAAECDKLRRQLEIAKGALMKVNSELNDLSPKRQWCINDICFALAAMEKLERGE